MSTTVSPIGKCGSHKLTVAGIAAIELAQAHGNRLVRHSSSPWARWSGPLYRRKLPMEFATDKTITTLIHHGILRVTQELKDHPVQVQLNENWLLTGEPV